MALNGTIPGDHLGFANLSRGSFLKPTKQH